VTTGINVANCVIERILLPIVDKSKKVKNEQIFYSISELWMLWKPGFTFGGLRQPFFRAIFY